MLPKDWGDSDYGMNQMQIHEVGATDVIFFVIVLLFILALIRLNFIRVSAPFPRSTCLHDLTQEVHEISNIFSKERIWFVTSIG